MEEGKQGRETSYKKRGGRVKIRGSVLASRERIVFQSGGKTVCPKDVLQRKRTINPAFP